MKIKNNVGGIDRMIRFGLAEILFLTAYFWMYGVAQVIVYIVALAIFATALFKFCGLYVIGSINTCSSEKKISRGIMVFSIAIFVLIGVIGSYYSVFFTKKFFLEDYNKMNHYYKQTLFYTGQNNRTEAVSNYSSLVKEYSAFYQKYSKYHPYVIAFDTKFDSDITEVNYTVTSLQEDVTTGDLLETHKKLETIRPVFQNLLKRNGFSMLAVYMVDFHDAMEKVIAGSDNKDAKQVLDVYQEVNDKLKAVEEVANDSEIQTIRQNLEQVVTSARNGNVDVLPKQARELKSSFVKVYLKRG